MFFCNFWSSFYLVPYVRDTLSESVFEPQSHRDH
jgi:hypothetical protein